MHCYYSLSVPPYLNEELTSSDTDVREGTDVSLRCHAKGSPVPDVTWRREDGQEISLGKSKGKKQIYALTVFTYVKVDNKWILKIKIQIRVWGKKEYT